MKLVKLTLYNFRQFFGEQTITFCGYSENGSNVTVIFGENGRGKTGIFRAIIFCLFGDRKLSQDGEVDTHELQLVNTTALQQSKDQLGKPVETYVETEFVHKGIPYKLRRTILGMIDGESCIEELKDVRLQYQDSDGNFKTENDMAEIDRLINRILDKRVKEYFLFDGEKIERLTRASPEQRREVANGIRNLLNIDSLEKAISATRRLNRKLDSELARNSTGELPKVIKRLEDNSTRRYQIEAQVETLERECELAEREKKNVDKTLDKYKEIKHLLEKRKGLEQRKADLETEIEELLVRLRKAAGKYSLLLALPIVKEVFGRIDEKKKTGEIPSEIRKDLIDRILDECRCICGRAIKPHQPEYTCILKWKNRTADSDLDDSALELWRHLASIISRSDDLCETLEFDLQKYATLRNSLDQVKLTLQDISDLIGQSERRDAVKLEEHRDKIEQKIISKKAKQERATDELVVLQQSYDKLLARRQELQRQEGVMNELGLRAQLALDCHEALKAVNVEFTQEIRKNIGKTATGLFERLLDKESRINLNKITVTEDYSLQVTDRWGKAFLANISAGQRQIMSISFIAALAKAASGEDILEMPFFMDTPFGRLSYEHRRNLIQEIPHSCAQWILLATDTEFTKKEAIMLKSGNRWGKFYVLKSMQDGCTQIQEIDVSNCLAVLRESIDEDEYGF